MSDGWIMRDWENRLLMSDGHYITIRVDGPLTAQKLRAARRTIDWKLEQLEKPEQQANGGTG